MTLRVLNPYRNPGEATCFIEGARCTAAALGYEISYAAGGVPDHLALALTAPPPEPVVTIEIPEEMPVPIEDRPVKRAKIKKRKRAEPDAGA